MASFFNIKVKKFMHPFYILNYLGQIFAKISTIKKKQWKQIKNQRTLMFFYNCEIIRFFFIGYFIQYPQLIMFWCPLLLKRKKMMFNPRLLMFWTSFLNTSIIAYCHFVVPIQHSCFSCGSLSSSVSNLNHSWTKTSHWFKFLPRMFKFGNVY